MTDSQIDDVPQQASAVALHIKLGEDIFGALFPLLRNHIDDSASWTYGDQQGCLFDTHGQEGDFVRQYDPRCVWTLVDGDDDRQCLVSGYHLVNRVGYLISTVPLREGLSASVRLERTPDYDALSRSSLPSVLVHPSLIDVLDGYLSPSDCIQAIDDLDLCLPQAHREVPAARRRSHKSVPLYRGRFGWVDVGFSYIHIDNTLHVVQVWHDADWGTPNRPEVDAVIGERTS